MIAVDSSIAIAAYSTWHTAHHAADEALTADAGIPAHALLETYAGLTGFPAPYRTPAREVARWLGERCATILAPPTMDAHRDLAATLAHTGVIGGAAYDALIALTAKLAGAPLVSLDRRAMATYRLVGAEAHLLG